MHSLLLLPLWNCFQNFYLHIFTGMSTDYASVNKKTDTKSGSQYDNNTIDQINKQFILIFTKKRTYLSNENWAVLKIIIFIHWM